MQNNIIKKLLNFKGVIVKKYKLDDFSNEFWLELPVKKHNCPCCNKSTNNIKDYYYRDFRDVPINFKPTIIHYRVRRYYCPDCNYSFAEHNDFIGKYKRTSFNLIGHIVQELSKLKNAKTIANEINVSPCYISKLYPYIAPTITHLPEVLCIDEFKR